MLPSKPIKPTCQSEISMLLKGYLSSLAEYLGSSLKTKHCTHYLLHLPLLSTPVVWDGLPLWRECQSSELSFQNAPQVPSEWSFNEFISLQDCIHQFSLDLIVSVCKSLAYKLPLRAFLYFSVRPLAFFVAFTSIRGNSSHCCHTLALNFLLAVSPVFFG